MSKNSPRQNVQVFSEWLNWARTKYPSLKKKKKIRPDYLYFDEDFSNSHNG